MDFDLDVKLDVDPETVLLLGLGHLEKFYKSAATLLIRYSFIALAVAPVASLPGFLFPPTSFIAGSTEDRVEPGLPLLTIKIGLELWDVRSSHSRELWASVCGSLLFACHFMRFCSKRDSTIFHCML